MPVTDAQLALIRESFDRLRQDISAPSVFFYEDLFRRAPQLRSLFRDDLTGQGMKFMSTLGVLVDNLHDPGSIRERYQDLGRTHASLGVTTEMFKPMGEALLATIADCLGDDMTPEIEAAWRAAYRQLAEAMITEGDISKD